MSKDGAVQDHLESQDIPANIWRSQIERLVREENLWGQEPLTPVLNSDPRKILFYAPVPWGRGNYERMLSVALRLRGHEVDEVICSGLFPACGMEHVDTKRPPCANCMNNAMKWFQTWKLPKPMTTGEFRESNDIERAVEVVRSLHLERFKDISIHALQELTYQGLPLGKRLFQKLCYHFSAIYTDHDAVLAYAYKAATTYVLNAWVAEALFRHKNYDKLVICNGKTIECGPIMDVALQKGIDVVVWEGHIVLDHDSPALEFNHHGVWDEVSKTPLTPEQRAHIEQFYEDWRNSKNTPHVIYSNPITDEAEISEMLGLRPDSFKVVIYSNILFDTSVIGMDIGFESLYEWARFFVRYAMENPDIDLIIRIHPSEKNLAKIPSPAKRRSSIADRLCQWLDNKLPANVHIVPGASEISSYTLLEMADVAATYTGTLSMEAPMHNRLSLVCGKVHYRGKGFTLDVSTPEEVQAVLDKREPLPRPTQEQVDLAWRYAYFYNCQMATDQDFYRRRDQSFHIRSLTPLAPGQSAYWDNVCASIADKLAFIDLSRQDRKPIPIKDLERKFNPLDRRYH